MRLWSLHPKFLDSKGLVALWREGLLARKVLHGKTKGYTNHPQLLRFRAHPTPLDAIDAYLAGVLQESRLRGYRFDTSKIDETTTAFTIEVTTGQLQFEWEHLLKKLATRAPELFKKHKNNQPEPHPLFTLKPGKIQSWEKPPTSHI